MGCVVIRCESDGYLRRVWAAKVSNDVRLVSFFSKHKTIIYVATKKIKILAKQLVLLKEKIRLVKARGPQFAGYGSSP